MEALLVLFLESFSWLKHLTYLSTIKIEKYAWLTVLNKRGILLVFRSDLNNRFRGHLEKRFWILTGEKIWFFFKVWHNFHPFSFSSFLLLLHLPFLFEWLCPKADCPKLIFQFFSEIRTFDALELWRFDNRRLRRLHHHLLSPCSCVDISAENRRQHFLTLNLQFSSVQF